MTKNFKSFKFKASFTIWRPHITVDEFGFNFKLLHIDLAQKVSLKLIPVNLLLDVDFKVTNLKVIIIIYIMQLVTIL